MHFPEQLFSLPLLKDVRTQPIELVHRQTSVSVVAGNSMVTTGLYTVPRDRILCLTNVGVLFSADAIGGSFTGGGVFALIGGQNHYLLATGNSGVTLAAGQPGIMYGATGSIWVPPGTGIEIYCSVNTNANHNALVSFAGITFPRGSVSIS